MPGSQLLFYTRHEPTRHAGEFPIPSGSCKGSWNIRRKLSQPDNAGEPSTIHHSWVEGTSKADTYVGRGHQEARRLDRPDHGAATTPQARLQLKNLTASMILTQIEGGQQGGEIFDAHRSPSKFKVTTLVTETKVTPH